MAYIVKYRGKVLGVRNSIKAAKELAENVAADLAAEQSSVGAAFYSFSAALSQIRVKKASKKEARYCGA